MEVRFIETVFLWGGFKVLVRPTMRTILFRIALFYRLIQYLPASF